MVRIMCKEVQQVIVKCKKGFKFKAIYFAREGEREREISKTPRHTRRLVCVRAKTRIFKKV